ncbi:MAG TPA: cytochrome c [Novosphingobium sp.]|nr:cytochrome c [Novosphingobium sp.]
MIAARIVIAGALLATGWAVYAKPAPAPKPTAPSAQDLVQARQAGMVMAATTMNLLRGASNNGTPLKNLAFSAGGLAKWAAAAPALFADSTRGVPSRALPAVWTDKAGFAAKSKAFADSTRALADAAKAEDKAAFDAALASTAASCKGCHDSYQAPPGPAPKAG